MQGACRAARLLLATALAGSFATIGARSAGSTLPPSWTTFRVASARLTFQLPSSWVKATHPGAVFFAESDDGTASVGLQIGAVKVANFQALARDAIDSGSAVMRSVDPHAVISTRELVTKVGRMEVVTTRLDETPPNDHTFELVAVAYWFARGRVPIALTFNSTESSFADWQPAFEHAALSIRFT